MSSDLWAIRSGCHASALPNDIARKPETILSTWLRLCSNKTLLTNQAAPVFKRPSYSLDSKIQSTDKNPGASWGLAGKAIRLPDQRPDAKPSPGACRAEQP